VASGSIDLLSVSGVKEFEVGKEGVCSFVVRASERTLLLRAQSPRDMARWVNNLRLQCDYLKGLPVESSIPGTMRRSVNRRDGKAKKRDAFDLMLGNLETALKQIEQLEEVS
jgi:hypothetical protein